MTEANIVNNNEQLEAERTKTNINSFIDNHIVQSSTIGAFWIINDNIILSLSTESLGTIVNKTYLKNLVNDNGRNICSIDLFTVKHNWSEKVLTPELVKIKKDDSIATKAEKIENFLNNNYKKVKYNSFVIANEKGEPEEFSIIQFFTTLKCLIKNL